MLNETTFKYERELRFWCQKVLPLVYDDSLSYYELLCKVVAKLNVLIENNNNLPQIIKDEIAKYVTVEGLREILEYIFDDLRANIANADEHDSATATDDRTAGDWVWLENELYYVVRDMDIGDAYIKTGTNPNVRETTVEERVKYYVQILQDADDALGDRIDDVVDDLADEVTARTDADTALGGRIDDAVDDLADEVTARTDADNAINDTIGNLNSLTTPDKTNVVNAINSVVSSIHHQIYYNVKDYGAVGNGTTDDTSAVLQAVNDATTAGKGIIYFPAGRYKLTQTINITTDAVGIMGDGNHATYLYCYHTGACIKAQRTDTTKAVHGFLLMNIGIINRGGGTTNSGVECWYHVNSTFFNVLVTDFFIGIKLEKFGNGAIYSVGITSTVLNARGFTVNDDSVSTVIENCYVGFSGEALTTGYGLTGTRGRIADLTIRYFDVGNGYVGILLNGEDYGSMAEPTDIRLYDIVVDSCRYCAIMLENFTHSGGILIEGGWFNPTIISNNGIIRINGCSNVTIADAHFQQLATSQAPVLYGVIASNSLFLQIMNNRFTNIQTCVSMNNCSFSQISGNAIEAPNPEAYTVGAYDISINNTQNTVISGNITNTKSLGFISKTSSNAYIITDNISRNKTSAFITGTASSDIIDNNISNI